MRSLGWHEAKRPSGPGCSTISHRMQGFLARTCLLALLSFETLTASYIADEWFELCKQCDLQGMKAFGIEDIMTTGMEDETCLSYCIASSMAGHQEKVSVMEWLFENGSVVDNGSFYHICVESSGQRHVDPEWEYFPLTVLAQVDEGRHHFDYTEAFCNACRYGCVRTVKALIGKVPCVNFEKLLPDTILLEDGRQEMRVGPTTPLMQAVIGNRIDVIHLLLETEKAEIEPQDSTNTAIRYEHAQVANLLVRLGGCIDPSLLTSASPFLQQTVLGAMQYRKRLVQDAVNFVTFFSANQQENGALDQARKSLVRAGYSRLEIDSCLNYDR